MRLLLFFLAAPLFAPTPCADIARLPNVTAAIQTATHCRVSITLRPSVDSEINSEVWLPVASEWNGKLLMEGGGGLVGNINTEGMAHAIREGYASASTDTGHTGSSGKFALGHPDKITVLRVTLRGHKSLPSTGGTAFPIRQARATSIIGRNQCFGRGGGFVNSAIAPVIGALVARRLNKCRFPSGVTATQMRLAARSLDR